MTNKISDFRKAQHMTQPQLAEKVGVSNYTVIQRYERGKVEPSVSTAIKIARALNTTVEELFPLEDEEVINDRS